VSNPSINISKRTPIIAQPTPGEFFFFKARKYIIMVKNYEIYKGEDNTEDEEKSS